MASDENGAAEMSLTTKYAVTASGWAGELSRPVPVFSDRAAAIAYAGSRQAHSAHRFTVDEIEVLDVVAGSVRVDASRHPFDCDCSDCRTDWMCGDA